jgi:hypothetical protein
MAGSGAINEKDTTLPLGKGNAWRAGPRVQVSFSSIRTSASTLFSNPFIDAKTDAELNQK